MSAHGIRAGDQARRPRAGQLRVGRWLSGGRLALVAGVLALAGCGTAAASGSVVPADAAPKAAAPRAATDLTQLKNCSDGKSQVASFQPAHPEQWYIDNDATIKAIRSRGTLLAGTSGDVRLWGARNPQTGRLEGFDIQLLQMIAAKLGVKLNTKVINYADRIPSLTGVGANGAAVTKVDIVAHTMTINCARWAQIDFSSEYYRAGQKVLVRRDPSANNGKGAAAANSIYQLKGKKVCVATGSTNITNLQTINTESGLNIQVEQSADLGDCLVRFQRGEVDAITGDDSVLAGFQAQDTTYSEVVGEQFSAEPYGLGFNKADPLFVQYVNVLLQQWRASNTLADMANTWMGAAAEPIPAATYGRTGNTTDTS